MNWTQLEGKPNHWYLVNVETQQVLATVFKGEQFYNTFGKKFLSEAAAKTYAEAHHTEDQTW